MKTTKPQISRSGFVSPFDRFFQNFLNESFLVPSSDFMPKVDIAEHENYFELIFALPGVVKEDIKIELEGNVLTVSGERKFSKDEQNKTWRKVETHYGAFSRSFELPDYVDKESVKAVNKEGILTITISKKQPEKKSTSIVIE